VKQSNTKTGEEVWWT